MATPRCVRILLCVALVAVTAAGASAQIEDQLGAYSGVNAEGYLKPLADAFGANLNSAYYSTAHISRSGVRFTLEFVVMAVLFSDDDRTFAATTEGDFIPESTVQAPTIVGSGEFASLGGAGGTTALFPGGLELSSFVLAVPQFRIGAIRGTEAIIRWLPTIDTGDAELGKVDMFGFGLRHSVSQYLDTSFDLSIGFLWQTLTVGDNEAGKDLLDTNALTIGVQASKRLGTGGLSAEPYTGLSFDKYSMSVDYESNVEAEPINLSLDFASENTLHWTLGIGLNLAIANAFFEYNVAGQSGFAFGLALGSLGI